MSVACHSTHHLLGLDSNGDDGTRKRGRDELIEGGKRGGGGGKDRKVEGSGAKDFRTRGNVGTSNLKDRTVAGVE